MDASNKKDEPKKRGRPATGKDPMLGFRSPPNLTDEIDAYADKQGLARSQAIRLLVSNALVGIPAVVAEIDRMEQSGVPELVASAKILRNIIARQ